MSLNLPAAMAALGDTHAYPPSDRVTRVRILHTHWSVLFLTDHHVYKLKRPIRRRFLNLATLAARRRNCREEVRLNRRLAPAVYLGVAALVQRPEGLRIDTAPDEPSTQAHGARTAALEWLVRMRRLPAAHMLDQRIRRGCLRGEEIESLARVLLGFYQRASQEPGLPERPAGRDYPRRLRQMAVGHGRAVLEALRALKPAARRGADGSWNKVLEAGRVQALVERLQHRISEETPALVTRARQGRLVEGHGDLRPEHVCLTEPPVIIDCLEFDPQLRILDPVDELAYLGLECDLLGEPRVGVVLERCHRAATGDHAGWQLAPLYRACRALMRAHLAVAHLTERPRPAPDSTFAARWLAATAAYLAAGAAALDRSPCPRGRQGERRVLTSGRFSASESVRPQEAPAQDR